MKKNTTKKIIVSPLNRFLMFGSLLPFIPSQIMNERKYSDTIKITILARTPKRATPAIAIEDNMVFIILIKQILLKYTFVPF